MQSCMWTIQVKKAATRAVSAQRGATHILCDTCTDFEAQMEIKGGLIKRTGLSTYPHLFVDGQSLGGWTGNIAAPVPHCVTPCDTALLITNADGCEHHTQMLRHSIHKGS